MNTPEEYPFLEETEIKDLSDDTELEEDDFEEPLPEHPLEDRPKKFARFLDYLSREQVDDHPDLLIQIWADAARPLVDSHPDKQQFEEVFAAALIQYYAEDRENELDSTPPVLDFLHYLAILLLKSNQLASCTLVLQLIHEYQRIASKIETKGYQVKNNYQIVNRGKPGISINHRETWKLFINIAFDHLTRRPEKIKKETKPKKVVTEQEPEKEIVAVPVEVRKALGSLETWSDATIRYQGKTVRAGWNVINFLEFLLERPNEMIQRRELAELMNNRNPNERKKYGEQHVISWIQHTKAKLAKLGIDQESVEIHKRQGIKLRVITASENSLIGFRHTGDLEEIEIPLATIGDLHIYEEKITVGDREVRARGNARSVLYYLITHSDRVISHSELAEYLTGEKQPILREKEYVLVKDAIKRVKEILIRLGITSAIKSIRNKGITLIPKAFSNTNNNDIISKE